MPTPDEAGEWPEASVGPTYIYDYDLWIQCGEDPTLYVWHLWMQGRKLPPPGWQPYEVPQMPINPLPLI